MQQVFGTVYAESLQNHKTLAKTSKLSGLSRLNVLCVEFLANYETLAKTSRLSRLSRLMLPKLRHIASSLCTQLRTILKQIIMIVRICLHMKRVRANSDVQG